MRVPGVQETGIEGGLVGEQEQALGVGVETAECVDVLWKVKFGQGAPSRARFRGELGKNPIRFMKRKKHGAN
jgi:hypothetical protein